MSSLFRLELNSNKKHFLKSISTFHRSLLFLLIWNWNNKFAHTLQSHSSLGNYTWFQTKMSKGYSNLFLTKTMQKPLPLGGGAPTSRAYIREYLLPDKSLLLWTVTVKGIDTQSHIVEQGNRAVTKISSCWVYEISWQAIEQLEGPFGFIFLLFPMKVAGGYTHSGREKSLAPST